MPANTNRQKSLISIRSTALVCCIGLTAVGLGCSHSSFATSAAVAAACASPLPKADLVTAWQANTGLGVVDSATGKGHAIPGTKGFGPEAVALSRDRCKIAFGSESLVWPGQKMPGGVFTVNIDGSGLRLIPHLNTGIGFSAISWSPDDRSVAVVNMSGYLLVASLRGELQGYKFPTSGYAGGSFVGWGGPSQVLVLGSKLSSPSRGWDVISLGSGGSRTVVLKSNAVPAGAITANDFAVSNDFRSVLVSVSGAGQRPWSLVRVSLSTHRASMLVSSEPVANAVWAADSLSIAFLLLSQATHSTAPIHILGAGRERVLPRGPADPALGLAWG